MQHPNKILKDYRKLLRLYNDGAVFTAIDTETTTVTPNTGRIMEIGAVKFNKDGVISLWSSLINPGQILSPFIIDLTHITQQMVDSALPIENLLPQLLDFSKDTIFLAHNAQFDLNFLNAECKNCRLPSTNNKTIDTLQLSRWAYPSLGKYKLDFLAQKMGINPGNHHRALDDAQTCMEVFLRILKDTAPVQKP